MDKLIFCFLLLFSTLTRAAYVDSVRVSNLPATQAISGDVSVLNFPASQAVTGIFWQATQPISAASLPLPSGAATSANQTTAIGHLANISSQTADVSGAIAADGDPANGNLLQVAGVDGSGNAQALKTTTGGLLEVNVLSAPTTAITAAALPLPSGASTSAKQDTAQTALDAIKTAVEIIDNAISGSEMQVDIVSSALPSGAATSALQSTIDTSINTLLKPASTLSKVTTVDTITNAVTVNSHNVTNAGTFAVQATLSGNPTVVASQDTTILQGSTTSGQKGALAFGAVTSAAPSYTNAQSSPLSIDTAGNLRVVATPSGTSTISGTVTANAGTNLNTSALALETTQSAMSAKLPATLGQKAMSASMAVALASDQSAIPVTQSGAWTISASNPSVSQTGVAVPASATLVGGYDGTNMRALRVSSVGVLSSDVTGSIVTAKLQDSTGTNWSMGQKSMSSSMPVTIADNQTSLKVSSDFTINQGSTTSGQKGELGFGAVTTSAPSYSNAQSSPLSLDTAGNLRVRETSRSTATLINVNDQATSINLISSDATRVAATIHNDSTSTLYVKFGATASTTSYTVKINPDGYYEFPMPIYTGAVDGIWSADASGAARTTAW